MKILILKPSSLGDVIQALPVLRLIKSHYPASEVYWWIDSRLSSLLEGDPQLAGVVPFHRKGYTTLRYWSELAGTLSWARAQRFDWVIDLQSLARTGALAWLANGRFLVGLDETREGARGFYDRVVRRGAYLTHAVDWYLKVLPELGVPVHSDFEWLPERGELASKVRQQAQFAPKLVAVVPGARWQNKRWPAEYYAALMRKIAAEQQEFGFVILGGAEDKPLGKELAGTVPAARALDLTGKSTLPEMIEWVRACDWVVTNDTGPMHVAAALRKPVIGLFGPTEPRRTGPYGQQQHALQLNLSCVPCMSSRCLHTPTLECLVALTPEVVIAAAQRRGLLNQSGLARTPSPRHAPALF